MSKRCGARAGRGTPEDAENALDAIFSRTGEWENSDESRLVASLVTRLRASTEAHSRLYLTLEDFDRMLPWGKLNDEWVNFMMYKFRMLATKKPDGKPRVHMFDTWLGVHIFSTAGGRYEYDFDKVRLSRTLS